MLEGGDWIRILPPNLVLSAGDPRTVVVQPVLGNLGPGFYRGALTFQFDDGSEPQVVEIFFQVVGAALATLGHSGTLLACAPQKLIAADRTLGKSYTATVASGTSLELQAADDCGNAVADATVVARFSNGDAPLALSSLGNGIYAGTWRPATASPQVTVTLSASHASLAAVEVRAQGKVLSNDAAPALFPGGIVNAASFVAGAPLAPGSIISLFGRNLAASIAQAEATPLPATLAGATVQIGGIDAPLYYAASGQINAQLPFEIAAATRPQVVVRGATSITMPETITVAAARPGIFAVAGSTQGAIVDVQGRVVDAAAPAAAGDVVVVYSTGMGAVDRAVASGHAAPSDPPAKVTTTVSVTIGGRPAIVHFAGLTPGFVGLYQVNVEIPAGVTPGASVPLVVSQGGVASNAVTLGIR
jgi:uncharacterized protein (TIGR03437 family)